MQVYLFWGIIVLCTLISLIFILPVFWLKINRDLFSRRWRYLSSIILVIIIPILAYCIYSNLGMSSQLQQYYSPQVKTKRIEAARLRPLYAQLQRETIKANLHLGIDVANLDLILHFATAHSHMADGILPLPILNLLRNVLVTAPKQVTALNLLAVHYYKSADYLQAVQYWDKVLKQFSPEMLKSDAAAVLLTKIAQAKNLQVDEPTK